MASLEGTAEIYKCPDDNKCLFRAFGYVMNKDSSDGKVRDLKDTVVAVIMSDEITYSSAMLGRSRP
eukprot:UN02800